ncbi:cobyrinate a,c-diamide synthase [Mesorhizobium sp. CN2-181]|uniref:cobyrinate a,c-diamide synthase n=1 Tax=Mesorhizobium yinganensis TaxID=3157707 RepID=UPI0032B7347A
MTARGIIVGAPRSGSGKTSVTIGLLRALKRRGFAVRGAKSGPDYIDPAFHEAATGRAGVNLDSWAMPPALIDRLLGESSEHADIVVVESAMGLFDGIVSAENRSGSAADLARRFGLPVLLVLDVSGQSQTAAAVAKGFAIYDPAVSIAGVVLNRVGSERHRKLATEAIEAVGLPVVGSVMRDPSMTLPERHLGLVQASEHADLDAHIDRLADVMERSLDLDRIVGMAASLGDVTPSSIKPSESTVIALHPPGQRIALAKDAAFTFLYPHLIAEWRNAGAEIVPFSPLADEAPDQSCNVCWLPGGYPELQAGRLAAANSFRNGMRRFAETRAVHGECGGFMVLGERLEDADGVTHNMLGLLGHSTSFARRKMNLGYRQATLLADCPIGKVGDTVRGHEFHYASLVEAGPDAPLAEIADGQGVALGAFGGRRGSVSGTFFHAIARAR